MKAELKRAADLIAFRRCEALARKRLSGDPRNPFRPRYGAEMTFATASQEAETLGYILKLLEKEAARECARRVFPTLDAILDFVVGLGLMALGGLGLAAACVVAGAPDSFTRAAALLSFTYNYTVNDADGDAVTVVEMLNDETLRTINNAPKGEQLSVSITSEKLYALGLNTVNNLVITATDGQGGTTYRRLTFKRTNSAPAISGQDEDLGQQTGSFAEKYTVTDVEGDNVVVTEFVDDKQIRSYQATLGQEETIELSRENWLVLANGDHQLRVEAVDGNFATSVRVWNFSKKETVIAFQFAQPEETDARATKILITPTWHIEGSVAKVEACNNAFDASPAWEDITAQVAINRVYNFLNQSKTAEKWGVNVRFTIEKNEGYEGEVSISGFGGAYE